MKVKLTILEFNQSDFSHIPLQETWTLPLGSAPRYGGDVVEGLKVPEGKVWLFPIGGDITRLRKELAKPGVVVEHMVNI